MKIIDMHCDTIHRIWQENAKTNNTTAGKWNLENEELMLNPDKMKRGGYYVQNFAMFIEAYDDQLKRIDCFARFKELLAVFKEQMKLYEDRVGVVTNVSEILENDTKGRLSAFLTVEGGEACQGDIEKLHYLYDQGVRMMTLTWNYPNELGYPNIDRMQMEGSTGQVDYTAASSPYVPDTEHGLTKTGIEFVKEMERIGMIIDVSHLSDAGFYDVLDNTTKPFVASHSNARKVCPFVRNLTDEMIRMLGERGGVTGLNYCHDFLFDNEISMNRAKMNGTSNAEIELSSEKYLDQTCEKIAEHARHIVNVGGMGVLGLGSDFDGIPPYVGMPEADKLDHLAHALGKKGFSTDQIDNIYYGNVMRVYEDVLL